MVICQLNLNITLSRWASSKCASCMPLTGKLKVGLADATGICPGQRASPGPARSQAATVPGGPLLVAGAGSCGHWAVLSDSESESPSALPESPLPASVPVALAASRKTRVASGKATCHPGWHTAQTQADSVHTAVCIIHTRCAQRHQTGRANRPPSPPQTT